MVSATASLNGSSRSHKRSSALASACAFFAKHRRGATTSRKQTPNASPRRLRCILTACACTMPSFPTTRMTRVEHSRTSLVVMVATAISPGLQRKATNSRRYEITPTTTCCAFASACPPTHNPRAAFPSTQTKVAAILSAPPFWLKREPHKKTKGALRLRNRDGFLRRVVVQWSLDSPVCRGCKRGEQGAARKGLQKDSVTNNSIVILPPDNSIRSPLPLCPTSSALASL